MVKNWSLHLIVVFVSAMSTAGVCVFGQEIKPQAKSQDVSSTKPQKIPQIPGVYYKSKDTYVKILDCTTKKFEGIHMDWLEIAKKTPVPSHDPVFLLYTVPIDSNGLESKDSTSTKPTKPLVKVVIHRWGSNEYPNIDYELKVLDSKNAIALLSFKGYFKPGLYVLLKVPANAGKGIGIIEDVKGLKHYITLDDEMNVLGEAIPISIFSVSE